MLLYIYLVICPRCPRMNLSWFKEISKFGSAFLTRIFSRISIYYKTTNNHNNLYRGQSFYSMFLLLFWRLFEQKLSKKMKLQIITTICIGDSCFYSMFLLLFWRLLCVVPAELSPESLEFVVINRLQGKTALINKPLNRWNIFPPGGNFSP